VGDGHVGRGPGGGESQPRGPGGPEGDAPLRLVPDEAEGCGLGDDAGRVPELVELLHATYGDNASLSLDEVEQYLGELGTAGRFDLVVINPAPVDTFYSRGMWGNGTSNMAHLVINYRY